ncbi:MAG TPA: RodZ domain-containing protein [Burkholderiaceae bacterium]|nr:RodZ domain-containing protein [Burkholderiaceae bacterium]
MNEGLVSNVRASTHHEANLTHVGSAPAPDGYGPRLARQRQSAGLSFSDIASTLRLHPNQVRAIEEEDLARLPAVAYVRGFIRSYARLLNIDAEPLLTDLNAKLAPAQESVVEGMATDSAARAAGQERRFPQWAIGIAVLILVALGFIGWQATLAPTALQAASEVVAPPAAPSAAAPLAPAPVAAPGTPLPAVITETSTLAASVEPVPTPADVAEPTVASSVTASGAAPTVLLRFSGASWAEVTDRGGKILLSQLSSAGAEHALDGELPLTVVIGDANFASVEVRGAAFNLQPFTRNNIARFTVK